jgi:hypothetical protein
MSRVTKKEALPVAYTERSFIVCDGCGEEQVDISMGGVLLGWRHITEPKEDGRGGVVVDGLDYGPECSAKILRAIQQESKAIQAEKLAAVAEVKGIA